MQKEWLIYENFYSSAICDSLVDDIQDLPTIEGVVGTESGFKLNSSRKSKIRFIDKQNTKYEWLFRDMWNLANDANSIFKYDIDTLNFVQIAEYDGKDAGEYMEHMDIIWREERHRKLSCTVQLSNHDTYTGGQLHFYRLQNGYPNEEEQYKINKQGTAIFFNSLTYHSILPVFEGKRYSLTAWFEGPRWR